MPSHQDTRIFSFGEESHLKYIIEVWEKMGAFTVTSNMVKSQKIFLISFFIFKEFWVRTFALLFSVLESRIRPVCFLLMYLIIARERMCMFVQ